MKKLFLTWQEPKNQHRFPIGCLEFDGKEYHFFYINGVEKARENGFSEVFSLSDLRKTYSSTHLFPLFTNRLMPRSRPDYRKYTESLNILAGEDDPMTVLGRSGGGKATDSYEVFPCPEIDGNGIYHTHFFAHGLRYMPKCSIDRAAELAAGDSLSLSHDLQNLYDRQALLLHTEDRYNLGYCPRYLAHDIFPILQANPQLVKVKIDRVNQPPTPFQSRLLCTLTAECGRDFVPFAGEEYQPLCPIHEPCRTGK
jgi:HIRAN domain